MTQICPLCNECISHSDYEAHVAQCNPPRFYYSINEERTQVDSPALTSLIERFMNVLENNSDIVWMQYYEFDEYDINNTISDFLGKVEVGLSFEEIEKVSCIIDDINDDKCPICLERYQDIDCKIRRLKCNHPYCDTCITRWLSKNKRCPCCQIDLEDAFLKLEKKIEVETEVT